MPYKDKEKQRETRLKWVNENREKLKLQRQIWTANNKEKVKLQRQTNRLNNLKKNKIREWKGKGMIDTDWDLVYEMFMAQTNCWICDKLFKGSDKCLDHDHETGELRYVVCRYCNSFKIG